MFKDASLRKVFISIPHHFEQLFRVGKGQVLLSNKKTISELFSSWVNNQPQLPTLPGNWKIPLLGFLLVTCVGRPQWVVQTKQSNCNFPRFRMREKDSNKTLGIEFKLGDIFLDNNRRKIICLKFKILQKYHIGNVKVFNSLEVLAILSNLK